MYALQREEGCSVRRKNFAGGGRFIVFIYDMVTNDGARYGVTKSHSILRAGSVLYAPMVGCDSQSICFGYYYCCAAPHA